MRRLLVTSRAGAEQMLASGGVTHLLSFRDPGSPLVRGAERSPDRLALAFHDVTSDGDSRYTPPTIDDVAKIIEYAHRLHRDSSFLVHCEMGIRRSTAGAYIVLCELFGPGREMQALRCLLHSRMQTDPRRPVEPNRLMVSIADLLMHRNGAMKSALTDAQQLSMTVSPDPYMSHHYMRRAGVAVGSPPPQIVVPSSPRIIVPRGGRRPRLTLLPRRR